MNIVPCKGQSTNPTEEHSSPLEQPPSSVQPPEYVTTSSHIQQQVDHLAMVCRTPVPEAIKCSLLRTNGVFRNLPVNKSESSCERKEPKMMRYGRNNGVSRRGGGGGVGGEGVGGDEGGGGHRENNRSNHNFRRDHRKNVVVREVIADGFLLDRCRDGRVHVTLTDDLWK